MGGRRGVGDGLYRVDNVVDANPHSCGREQETHAGAKHHWSRAHWWPDTVQLRRWSWSFDVCIALGRGAGSGSTELGVQSERVHGHIVDALEGCMYMYMCACA